MENEADDEDFVEQQAGESGDSVEAYEPLDDEEITRQGKFMANYFGIFYGPSVEKPGAFQPTPFGDRDLDRPVEVKNFLSFSYFVADGLAITPTAYWSWYAGPQQFRMNDPFLRVSKESLVTTELLNLYGDVRLHIPTSRESRDSNLITGLQSLQSLSFQVWQSPLAIGLYSSQRINFFGNNGWGNDLELYLGPNLFYQIADNASLTVLYEIQVNHQFGEKPFHFWTPGAGLEPGVAWDVTRDLMINPYLNIPTSGNVSLRSVSLGMMLNWRLL